MPAMPEHAEDMAPRLRAADVLEVYRSHGHGALEALLSGLDSSEEAYTLFLDGRPAAMFGVAPIQRSLLGTVWAHSIWLLGTDDLTRHPRDFLRTSRRVFPYIASRYPVLFNMVDDEYTGALRWLEWLGFWVGYPEPFGPFGHPFRSVVYRRK